jgi:hypothetical protein
MADFLEQYGAGDERRGKIIKRVVISLASLLVVAGLLFYGFHTYLQERQVKRFFQLLATHDYKAAYALWGCTDANPCRDYPMTSFLQDWGPPGVSVSRFEVLNGDSCGSGVIVDVDAGTAGDKKLWVERDSLVIGFTPPWPNVAPGECPQGNRIAVLVRNLKYRLHGRTYQ